MDSPKTLQEALVYFADPEQAFQFAVKLRWPDGNVTCPRCGGSKHSFIKTRRIWFCYDCKKQFTVKVKTIMEDSAIGLDKWIAAIWIVANSKNGVSSWEIHRSLGVTQKSAWFMLHRIREAMKEGKFGRGKIGGGRGANWKQTKLTLAGKPRICTVPAESAANSRGAYSSGRRLSRASLTAIFARFASRSPKY